MATCGTLNMEYPLSRNPEVTMNPFQMLHEITTQVESLFPQLSRPLTNSLAALTCGVVRAQSATLSRASAAAPGPAQDTSKLRRAQRLLANPGLEVDTIQSALAAQILASQAGRLDLILDATTTGATAHFGGLHTLMLALRDHGRALPLCWQCWPAHQSGQDWASAQKRFFVRVEQVRPANTDVVLMADRGLSGAPLIQRLQAHGWHYLLRVIEKTRIQLPDGRVRMLKELVSQPGDEVLLTAVRMYAPRHKPGAHRVSEWEEASVTNVVIVWPVEADQPWYLVTDLPAERRRCAEYRQRTAIEELFRDLKSRGWGWDRSRVREPQRVAALLVVLTIATLWMLALGQRVVRYGHRRHLEPGSRRWYSRFQLGLRWLERLVTEGKPVPCYLRLLPEARAPVKLS